MFLCCVVCCWSCWFSYLSGIIWADDQWGCEYSRRCMVLFSIVSMIIYAQSRLNSHLTDINLHIGLLTTHACPLTSVIVQTGYWYWMSVNWIIMLNLYFWYILFYFFCMIIVFLNSGHCDRSNCMLLFCVVSYWPGRLPHISSWFWSNHKWRCKFIFYQGALMMFACHVLEFLSFGILCFYPFECLKSFCP